MNLCLRPDERGAIIGRTGTGKSFLARHLLPTRGALAIIDPKRGFDVPKVPVFENAKEIIRRKPPRFIYRPNAEHMTDIAAYDAVYKYCYERGEITVYTDDVVGIMERQRFPHYLQVCYQMGRAKNVAMLSAFQRPSWLPGFMMSEANRLYVFPLSYPADKKKVSEMVPGYAPDSIRPTSDIKDRLHSFWFYSDRETERAVYTRLTTTKART